MARCSSSSASLHSSLARCCRRHSASLSLCSGVRLLGAVIIGADGGVFSASSGCTCGPRALCLAVIEDGLEVLVCRCAAAHELGRDVEADLDRVELRGIRRRGRAVTERRRWRHLSRRACGRRSAWFGLEFVRTFGWTLNVPRRFIKPKGLGPQERGKKRLVDPE